MHSYLLLLFASLFLTVQKCGTPQLATDNPQQITQVKFQSFTRGGQKEVTVEPKKISIKEQGFNTSDIEKEISTEDWTRLLTHGSKLQLSELPNLEAPSNDRAADRAWHSTITIIAGSREYQCQTFDGNKAHSKLLELMGEVMRLEEKYK